VKQCCQAVAKKSHTNGRLKMDAILNWADSSRMGKPDLETYTRQATVAVGNTVWMNGAHLRLSKPFCYNNCALNRAFIEA
jgi:hypothetical protein